MLLLSAAYCDVGDHLECHRWLVRESQRYGLNWSTLWAQVHVVYGRMCIIYGYDVVDSGEY